MLESSSDQVESPSVDAVAKDHLSPKHDPLRATKGIMLGAFAGAVLWALVILLLWFALR